jgi:pyruvate-ferredoxin/flavodoxin oxidoreductase
MILQAEAVADYLRETRKLKVGVVNLTMFRPFPGDLLGPILKGRQGRGGAGKNRPAAGRGPALMREVRATLTKCLENGMAIGRRGERPPYPGYATYKSGPTCPASIPAATAWAPATSSPRV